MRSDIEKKRLRTHGICLVGTIVAGLLTSSQIEHLELTILFIAGIAYGEWRAFVETNAAGRNKPEI